MKKRYIQSLIVVLGVITVLGIAILNQTKTTFNEGITKTGSQIAAGIIETPSGWIEEDGEWYYINESTLEKEAGWIEVDGEKYYLDPETKIRQTGLLKLSEEEWYYLNEEGIMQKDCIVENYVLDENGKVERILLTSEEQDARREELQPEIDEIAQKYGATGVSVALIENGEVTNHWEYGYAVKNSIEMSEDTKIRIASITKVILAMNIFKLVDQGVVDLDESIGTYWGFPVANPKYPEDAISFRSILSHTSSIADVDSYKNIEGRLRNSDVFRNVKPLDPAGWSYCNYAFGVAGTTLEKAANKSIHEIARESFFDPMGIDAAFAPGKIKSQEFLANLYYADGSVARSRESMAGMMGSDTPGGNGAYMAGGLYASAKDLAKMISILANDGVYDGERYLSEESVDIMETQYCDAILHEVEVIQCFPLKYLENIYDESSLYFHTGSAYGVFNLFSYNPETKNGVVVLTTGASGICDEYGIYAVCGEISKVLYNDAAKWLK